MYVTRSNSGKNWKIVWNDVYTCVNHKIHSDVANEWVSLSHTLTHHILTHTNTYTQLWLYKRLCYYVIRLSLHFSTAVNSREGLVTIIEELSLFSAWFPFIRFVFTVNVVVVALYMMQNGNLESGRRINCITSLMFALKYSHKVIDCFAFIYFCCLMFVLIECRAKYDLIE